MTSEELNSELMKTPCPVCESMNTKVIQKIMDIPHFPEMWFFNLTCLDCHYKYNDFINLSVKEPMRYIYHAENKEDYTTKIVRAANGTIRFPQIGAMIEPGPNADGFVNNIEGILRDIQGKVKFLLNDAETQEERQKISNYIKMIDAVAKLFIFLVHPGGSSRLDNQHLINLLALRQGHR